MLPAALLLLADGRSPTGAYLHSGGVEAAVAGGFVRDDADLFAFLQGRLHTVGRVAAGLAAAAADPGADLAALDAEADARTPSPAARDASRAQGRALLRMVRAAWPQAREAGLGPRPHAALVLGVATAAAGGGPVDAAALAAGGAVTGPASAAVRLLGLDPLTVTGLLAALAPAVDAVASAAARDAAASRLPDDSAPQLDVLAEAHVERLPAGNPPRARMFAS
jgi:urease accessory protein